MHGNGMAKRIRHDGREAIDDPTLTAFQLHISAFRPVSRVHSGEAQKAGTDPNRGGDEVRRPRPDARSRPGSETQRR